MQELDFIIYARGGGGMRLRHDQLLAPVVGAIRVLVFTAFV